MFFTEVQASGLLMGCAVTRERLRTLLGWRHRLAIGWKNDRRLLQRVLQRFQSPNLDLVASGLGRAVQQFARLEWVGNAFLRLPGWDELLLDLHQLQGCEYAGALLAHALGGLRRVRYQDRSHFLLGKLVEPDRCPLAAAPIRGQLSCWESVELARNGLGFVRELCMPRSLICFHFPDLLMGHLALSQAHQHDAVAGNEGAELALELAKVLLTPKVADDAPTCDANVAPAGGDGRG